MLTLSAVVPLALHLAFPSGGDVAVGDQPAHRFAAEPCGLPGLQRLEELRGSVVLLLFADPEAAAFKRVTVAAAALEKRYGRDLAILISAPAVESSWREAFAQRCFAGGVAFTTEAPVQVPAGARPYAVVLDAFGIVVHAERAEVELDEAKKAIETAVSGVKYGESYAPPALGQVWKGFEKGAVQDGLDRLRELSSSSDSMTAQAASIALQWWPPRIVSPFERAERLVAEERWSEAREMLADLFTRFPGMERSKDSFAEKVRTLREKLPKEGPALEADAAFVALSKDIAAKGPTKALREKLARFVADHGDVPAGLRAKTLLDRLGASSQLPR